jgi:biopolymer transport protein ExbB
MQSQSGLIALWQQGDGVTRAVAVLLLLMSLASWMVILVKALGLMQVSRQGKAVEGFWAAPDYDAGVARLGASDNPFSQIAINGREARDHFQTHGAQTSLRDSMDLDDWVTRCLRNAVDDASAQLQSGLAILASVGSTAPFVGLFGTVWGIYHALMSISSAGQATIDKVAGPIGEALIMTALGLAVAIPAVLGYNALVRGNKSVVRQFNRFATDVHALVVTGARVGKGS